MKLLLISDLEQARYWQITPEALADVDLILSAGDLKPVYLNRLAQAGLSSARRTWLLYVHGNHDESYASRLSRQCVCVDGDLLTVRGLRILGLGGSPRYRPGPHQYSEEEMQRRIGDLAGKISRSGGADIILTHAPPLGVGDGDGAVHRGFACFLPLLDAVKPRFLVHGHVHLPEGSDAGRIRRYGETTVVNACGSCFLEL